MHHFECDSASKALIKRLFFFLIKISMTALFSERVDEFLCY